MRIVHVGFIKGMYARKVVDMTVSWPSSSWFASIVPTRNVNGTTTTATGISA